LCFSLAGVFINVKMGVLLKPEFEANHPFLFILKETNNGAVLFIGRFSKP
jgi:serine protease inhibitor